MKKYILIIFSILLTILFACNIAFSFNFKSVSNISKLNEIKKSKIAENILGIINDLKSIPNGSISKVQRETQNINNYMNEIGSEIIRCLKEEDKEGMNELFCDRIKNTNYSYDRINIVFDYIMNNGGVYIGNGEWTSPVGHGSNNYDGKTVEYLSCKYLGDVKIGDKEYDLRFTAYQILKKHKEYEGVHCIYFVEKIDGETLDKILQNKEKKIEMKRYLGMDLINTNYDTYDDESILPKELYLNDSYEIPSNLEDDR